MRHTAIRRSDLRRSAKDVSLRLHLLAANCVALPPAKVEHKFVST
jgi:hypothetical protein